VNATKSRPGNRDKLGSRIQFHSTGAERDHGPVECQVLVGELAHVAHQAGFGMVAVEYRMRQEIAFAYQFRWQAAPGHVIGFMEGDVGAVVVCKHVEQLFDIGTRGDFIERDTNGVGVYFAQIESFRARRSKDEFGGVTGAHGDGVEKMIGLYIETKSAQAGSEDYGQAIDALRDPGQFLRSVVNRVHARHDCQQRLRGADITGRLLATNVLLTRL